MPKALITDLLARHAKTPDGKRFTIWDQALPGFGLRVSARTKTWTVMLDRKARRRITVGRYPTLGVQAARIEARRVINGAAVLRNTPGITSLTFFAALEKFIELHLPKNRRSTAIERERILQKHCVPVWKSRLMTDIHRGDVLRVLDALGDTPVMANNVFAVIRLFFRWSVRRGYLLSSPCEALQAPAKRVSRERVLTPDELRIVLSQALTAGTFGTIVSLLAFTGQRRGEIAALHSEWINREALTITFPKHITKNGQEHVLPITPYVLQLLPEREGLLFPARGQHTRAFNGWSKSMNAFRHCCGFADFTLHDLRRTAATNMAELGTAPHVIEKVLNHVTGSTSQSISMIGRIYNRARYLPQMRDALLLHEHFLRRQFDCPAQSLT